MRPPPGPPGRIVLLNGTSSSGKSSVARSLLQTLDTPWFHLSVDAFGEMRALVRVPEADIDAMLARTRAGFHRAVAGMAAAGNDVVVDHLFSEPWRLDDCLTLFEPFDVVFVGLHCSAAELTRRELARGDRTPGQAAAQLALVHAHRRYDLELDTTALNADSAARIGAFLRSRPTGPTAFERLRVAHKRNGASCGQGVSPAGETDTMPA
ncbi:AAA family ATPase [Actinoplanes sp. TBRC 11911]|uniref:chloramphenicol phosphotransferase CPT family protein n=1 Tax=Actinoplanes sp. TBRC 11911 TaxID=2729386 RepID=UPI00145E15D7|nr:AAA family ATPase [Actinoplanes sp. TBRC 11911]NMO53639.1 AAA family ATPase [Actinoplanes sp. TBRC 11911]